MNDFGSATMMGVLTEIDCDVEVAVDEPRLYGPRKTDMQIKNANDGNVVTPMKAMGAAAGR